MKPQTPLATASLALALLSTLNPQLSPLFAQGSLTPPGAPGPTMKTLAQVEPRTPISSAPFTISIPGSYYLTTNLNVTGGSAIIVAAGGVTLDLNGFTISSTARSAEGCGILLTNGACNLSVYNGHIKGGVTNNGGVYSGPGFLYGIRPDGTAPFNTRVAGLSVSGCLMSGIHLAVGDSTVVESCTVRTVGGDGILASVVKSSTVVECGGSAIICDQVSDCAVRNVGGYGLWGNTIKSSVAMACASYAISGEQVTDSHGESNGGSGRGIQASTAQNCFGYSAGGDGISAGNALNCVGQSDGSGNGISANQALNCRGSSGTGYGIFATTALGCYGASSTSYGLYAQIIAQNSQGSSSSGVGLRAGNMAIGCRGFSNSSTGLVTSLANSCLGVGSPAVSATYKYNMP